VKWVTHQTVTVGAALVLAMSPAAVAAALAGAVLPDVLDQKRAALSRNPQRAFNRIHRGSSHWFGWWLALFLLPVAAASPLSDWPVVADLLFGLGFGALAHVAQDMVTTAGVPLVPWTRKNKLSLRLFSTGSLGEYAFLAAALVLCGLILFQRFQNGDAGFTKYLDLVADLLR